MHELVGTRSTEEYEPTWTISFIVNTVSLNGTGLQDLNPAYLLGKLLGGHRDRLIVCTVPMQDKDQDASRIRSTAERPKAD